MEIIDLTYFKNKLLHFLMENHPNIIQKEGGNINTYIESKANEALEVFLNHYQKGIQQDIAMENANNTLKEGLIFSHYNYIYNLLDEFYPDKFESLSKNNTLEKTIIEIINYSSSIFDKYDTTDNYEFSDIMDTELIGSIELYFTANGLQ